MTKRQRFTLLATIIGSGVVLLDGSVVNLALPALHRDMGASFSDLQWVIDGYLLSLSALILLGGSLGDIFGRKKMYIFGLIGFGLVSMACGFATTPVMLILLRIVQGVFGALVVPGGLAIINTNFAPDQRGKAIGQWAGWSGIAAAIGPLAGGYLIDTFSWHWIFFLNVPLIIICAWLAIIGARESLPERARHIDFTGAGLAAAFLACFTYALIEGPGRHWDMPTIGLLAAGIILLAIFVAVEWRKRDPMVNLKLFASRNFTGANIMTFAIYGAMSGFFFALVIYLQTVLHYSSTLAGVTLVPVTVMLLIFSGRLGGLTQKFGPRIFMTVGPIIMALGMLLLVPLGPNANYIWNVLVPIIVFAAGLCLMVAPLTITVMSAVSDEHSGIASGINNAVSRAAGLIIIALLGLFGASNYVASVVLCVCLAAGAGVVSFLIIRNPKKLKT
ncbi:MAG TPA: MFS transporter [Candidatus Saccharimonas sp.]|nr:MFS transporter [Candidatus Saccharimonas sp.]